MNLSDYALKKKYVLLIALACFVASGTTNLIASFNEYNKNIATKQP